MTDTPKRIELECGHILWLITIPDTIDDMLWCARCDAYKEVAPSAAKFKGVWVLDPVGEFRSMRHSKRQFTGECLYEGCDISKNSTNYLTLRERMHAHYMRAHTKWTVIEIEYVDTKLPPNSPPPF